MPQVNRLTSGRQIGFDQIAAGVAIAFLGLGVVAVLSRSPRRRRECSQSATVLAARNLNRAAGTLALSVLADSAVEHYRGSFHNKAMYTPLAVSAATLAFSLHGMADRRGFAHKARDVDYVLAALTGMMGTGFHVFNVSRQPGGVTWASLFYRAPLGAPAAIMLSGLLGFAAERVRDTPATRRPTIFSLPAGRSIAAVTALGLLGTTAEAALLHFRGAYHNPYMFLPVTLPPLAAALLARASVLDSGRRAEGDPPRGPHALALWALRVTAAMGFAGAGFHAYGVHRNMGGWANWRQTLLNGPPVPAPPSFTGLALAGLASLRLLEDRPDA